MEAIQAFIAANPWTTVLIAGVIGFLSGAYFVWHNRKGRTVGSAPDMLHARGQYELVGILEPTDENAAKGVLCLKRYWPNRPNKSGVIHYVWRDAKVSVPKGSQFSIGARYTILPCNGFLTLVPRTLAPS